MGIDLIKNEEEVNIRLEITDEMKENLLEATKWIRFMNIVGCISMGLLAFVVFIGWFLYDAFCFVKSNNDTYGLADKVIVASSILLIIGVLTHGLFDTIYFRPQVQFLFWTMIAAASSVITQKQHIADNIEV